MQLDLHYDVVLDFLKTLLCAACFPETWSYRVKTIQCALCRIPCRVDKKLHENLHFNIELLPFVPSVLTYIFMIDVSLPYTQPTTSPRIADFTERILLQLKPLTEGDEEIQNHVVEENEVGEQDERTQAIKLLKTGTTSTRKQPKYAAQTVGN